MSFSRHNIEKRRLIELVRLNPILWDCRLPHYKRSDKKKAIKWNELGRVFSVSGQRVQRTFTSLREIFRRELNHEKLLGNRFCSKWEYYDDMSYLKGVIRERKSRERIKKSIHHNGLNLGSYPNTMDEYQYFAPNDPNNPNKFNQTSLQQTEDQNVDKCSVGNTVMQSNTAQQTESLKNQSFIHSNEQTLNNNIDGMNVITNNRLGQIPKCLETLRQQQMQQTNDLHTQTMDDPQKVEFETSISAEVNLCSSSSSISFYIKSEIDTDEDSYEEFIYNDSVEKLSDMIYLTAPQDRMSNIVQLPIVSGTDTRTKKFNRNIYEEDCLGSGKKVHESNLRTGNLTVMNNTPIIETLPQQRSSKKNIEAGGDETLSSEGSHVTLHSCVSMPLAQQPITARQQLYTNFGVFLATRLNTLCENLADELMNRILMLVAEI